MPAWNDNMAGHEEASEQVSVNSAFTCWSWLLSNAHQFCSSNVSSLPLLCACIRYEHHCIFVYLGLQHKWNQLSSNNSRHTSRIHKGLHARKWPDLMTTKPDAHSTLGYHWTDYTGITLDDAIVQWSSSGNPVLIYIIGTHWKSTGGPLYAHWLPTILSTVALKSTLGSKFQANRIATGLPLNCHWIATGSG